MKVSVGNGKGAVPDRCRAADSEERLRTKKLAQGCQGIGSEEEAA